MLYNDELDKTVLRRDAERSCGVIKMLRQRK
jgi:hypothetical protein